MKEQSRYIRNAPVYRTLPLSDLKNLPAGTSLLAIGFAARALADTLEGHELQLSVRDTLEQCLASSVAAERFDYVVVTDEDQAALLLNDADSLQNLCQKTKCVMLPVVQKEDQLGVIWLVGAPSYESNQDIHWRWCTAGDSSLSIIITRQPAAAADIMFAFTIWLAPGILQSSGKECKFRIKCNAQESDMHLSHGTRLSVPISFQGDFAIIKLTAHCKPASTGADKRALSFAITNPVLVDGRGHALMDSAHFCSGLSMPGSLGVRHKLHKGGFYEVGGSIVRNSATSQNQILSLSHGSPSLGMHCDDYTPWLKKEPDLQYKDVAWFSATTTTRQV